MIALADPPFLHFPRLAVLGPLVLGIYVVHFAFVDLLRPLDAILVSHLWWGFAYTISVFCLSAVAALVMSRSRYTRALVM